MITSSKDVTRLESFGDELRLSVNCTDELSYIPGEIFLENTFTRDTEIIAQSIKSALGSYCLPTTVKDGHVVVRNLSDFVAMKANNRDASFRIKVNRSVTDCQFLLD